MRAAVPPVETKEEEERPIALARTTTTTNTVTSAYKFADTYTTTMCLLVFSLCSYSRHDRPKQREDNKSRRAAYDIRVGFVTLSGAHDDGDGIGLRTPRR